MARRALRGGRMISQPRRRIGGAAVLIFALAVLGVGAAAIVYAPGLIARMPQPSPAAEPTAPVRGAVGLPAKGGGATAAEPAAPVWTVDKAASRLTFRASLGGEPVDGVFKSWDAEIAFDPANLKASRAMFVVETASALTGEPNRDELLPTPNWLWTHRYPKATLVTRSIAETAPDHYLASADIRIRGLTRRISVPFTVQIAHDVGKMQATVRLDRNVFSVGQVPGMPLQALAPEVQLNLRLTARKGR